jgi:capsular polysaccharide biosynthesis protein
MDDIINLLDLLEALKKKLWLIFLSIGIGGVLAAGVTHFFVEPKYSSSAEMMVSMPSADTVSTKANEISTNLLLINTYNDMIKSNFIMDKVRTTLNEKTEFNFTSNSAIKEAVSVKTTEDSMLFSISATANTPKKAQDIANVVAQTFQQNAKNGLKNTIDEITILSKAEESPKPVSPSLKKYTLLGSAAGGVVCSLVVLLVELFNQKIKDEEFISSKLEQPLLGTVSKIGNKTRKKSRGKNLI